MEKLVISEDLSKELSKDSIDLMSEIRDKVMANQDLKIAMLSGCQIETVFNDKTNTLTVRTIDKVSILKAPNGDPISVIIKQVNK